MVSETDGLDRPNYYQKGNTINPSAMTTIKKSSPDATNGGELHFSVEGGNERISFVRFELPDLSKDDVVVRATLRLYLVRYHVDEGQETFNVSVDAFPHGGKWEDGTVSWNERIEDRGSFVVNSFKIVTQYLHASHFEVDVTSAIDLAKERRITFKLYTDEVGGRVDFAGKGWNGGENVPELIIVTEKQPE